MTTLTGRIRYRSAKIGLFGSAALVLQVEERRTEGELAAYLEYTYWRDATVMDLSPSIDFWNPIDTAREKK
jgi:hypothetical protein